MSIGGTIGTTGGAATHHCRHAIQDVHDGLLELDFFDRFGNMSVYCKLDLKPVALRAYSCSRQSSSFDSFGVSIVWYMGRSLQQILGQTSIRDASGCYFVFPNVSVRPLRDCRIAGVSGQDS